jgi:hypothetical protein
MARLLAIAFFLPSAALGRTTGPGRIELFGHDIVVRSFVKYQGEAIWETDVLTIDKKRLLRDRQIYIWESGSFEGLGFAVGMHTTGAMCDDQFFVLVFPENARPKTRTLQKTRCSESSKAPARCATRAMSCSARRARPGTVARAPC